MYGRPIQKVRIFVPRWLECAFRPLGAPKPQQSTTPVGAQCLHYKGHEDPHLLDGFPYIHGQAIDLWTCAEREPSTDRPPTCTPIAGPAGPKSVLN